MADNTNAGTAGEQPIAERKRFRSAEVLRALIAEADIIEAWYGENLYSSFIKKHGRRPNREQAATIGRLLGGQVEDDDGNMQPPLTGEAAHRIEACRKAASRRYDHILRLRQAIAALAENEDDPADVIGTGSCLLNKDAIAAQLDVALGWLSRFAEEWHRREIRPQYPPGAKSGKE